MTEALRKPICTPPPRSVFAGMNQTGEPAASSRHPAKARPATSIESRDGLALLPYHARWVGACLFGVGAVLGLLRIHFGVRLDALQLPVFAVHASYFKTRSLVWIRTDLTDEVAWVSLLCGATVLALSRRRDERPTFVLLRLRALLLALIFDTGLLSLAAFTFFGVSFIHVLVAAAIAPPLSYLAIFRYLLWRDQIRSRADINQRLPDALVR